MLLHIHSFMTHFFNNISYITNIIILIQVYILWYILKVYTKISCSNTNSDIKTIISYKGNELLDDIITHIKTTKLDPFIKHGIFVNFFK